jgi:hypothetical protein
MAPSRMSDEVEISQDILPFYPRSLCQRYRADELNISVTKEVLDPARIGWQPNYEMYLARAAARLRVGGPSGSLPIGFPREMQGDLVWSGTRKIEEVQYTVQLQDFQKAEVEEALKHFKGWISSAAVALC